MNAIALRDLHGPAVNVKKGEVIQGVDQETLAIWVAAGVAAPMDGSAAHVAAPAEPATAASLYQGLVYAVLRAMAKERGLDTKGKAPDLVARLEADDADKAPVGADAPDVEPEA